MMKIDNGIIHYEISKPPPKHSQNGIAGMGEKQVSFEQKVETKKQSGQDTIVNLSTVSKDVRTARVIIASEPDVRENMVSELKQKIESGKYGIDHKAVADKIVDSFLDEIS